MAVSFEMKQRAAGIVTAYDPETRDAVYRHLWQGYVKADIRARAASTGTEMNEDQVEFAADLYAYDGEYDCNESYWSNIDNVIRLALERTY